jgi:hypothetical protein
MSNNSLFLTELNNLAVKYQEDHENRFRVAVENIKGEIKRTVQEGYSELIIEDTIDDKFLNILRNEGVNVTSFPGYVEISGWYKVADRCKRVPGFKLRL